MQKLVIIAIFFVLCFGLRAQQLPGVSENIPFLVTFSKDADHSWGDDDFCQIAFMVVPKTCTQPFYLRIFDPDNGGRHDEKRGSFNSSTRFTIYGAGCFSDKDEENKDPVGDYKRGNLLFTKTFAQDTACDNKWYTFGPINPAEGDLKPDLGGYVFKLVVEGMQGDDGNLYRCFLSTHADKNLKVEGGNVFVYEYSFRLNADKSTSHIYPYVDVNTVAVKQYNFDFDNDANIMITSMSNPAIMATVSNDNEWKQSLHQMTDKDKNSSLDVQITKTGEAHNNNVVFVFTNQYGKYMPFYAVPLGAIPRKNIKVKPKK